jgi:hypothetical protein
LYQAFALASFQANHGNSIIVKFEGLNSVPAGKRLIIESVGIQLQSPESAVCWIDQVSRAYSPSLQPAAVPGWGFMTNYMTKLVIEEGDFQIKCALKNSSVDAGAQAIVTGTLLNVD